MSKEPTIYKFKLNAKVFNELAKCGKLPLIRMNDGSFTISASDIKVNIKANSADRMTAVYSKTNPTKFDYMGQAHDAQVNITKIPPKSQKLLEKKATNDQIPNKIEASKKEINPQIIAPVDTLSSQNTNPPPKPMTPIIKNSPASPSSHTKIPTDEKLREERRRIRNMTEEMTNAKKARQTKLIDIETAAAIDKSISDAKRTKPVVKKGKKPDHGIYTPPPLTKQPSESFTPPHATSLQAYSENMPTKSAASPLNHSRAPSYDPHDQSKKHAKEAEPIDQDTLSPSVLSKPKQSSRASSSSTFSSLSPEQHRPAKRKQPESGSFEDELLDADKPLSLYDRIRYQLALGAFTIAFLSKLCKTSADEVEATASKVGIRLSNPRESYCLKPQVYSKLDIWEWPLYTDAERTKALKNALEAYKLLKLPRSDPAYENLTKPNGKEISPSAQKAAAARKRSKMEEQRRRMLNPSKRGTLTSAGPNTVTKTTKNSKLSVPPCKLDSPLSNRNANRSPYREENSRAMSPYLPANKTDPVMTPPVEEMDIDTPSEKTHKVSSSDRTPVPDKVHSTTQSGSSASSTTSYHSSSTSPTKDKEGAITPVPSEALPATIESSDNHNAFGGLYEALYGGTSSIGRDAIVKIPDQKKFNAYCRKFIFEQKTLHNLKRKIATRYSNYIDELKEHYTDQKIKNKSSATSYLEKVNQIYLQKNTNAQQEIDSFDEDLDTMSRKKQRLFYMQTVIRENIKELKYKIPKECYIQQMDLYNY